MFAYSLMRTFLSLKPQASMPLLRSGWHINLILSFCLWTSLVCRVLGTLLDVGFLYIQIKIWLSPVTMPILVFNHVWLCNPVACGLPGPSVHGILQARILEWAAIPLSRELSWPKDQNQVSLIAGRFFTIWAKGRPS